MRNLFLAKINSKQQHDCVWGREGGGSDVQSEQTFPFFLSNDTIILESEPQSSSGSSVFGQ